MAVVLNSSPAGQRPRALLDELREAIDTALNPLLGEGEPVALVDFPNHSNAGDAAIWVGELRFLERLSVPVAYACEMRSFSARHLRNALPAGTVLLHGGGNFGDLWPTFQEFRERVVRALPEHRIIQLPQSIHFSNDQALRRSASVFRQHPDATILVRDLPSLELVDREFGIPAKLCPDMAFALDPFPRPTPTRDVLVLARRDVEAIGGATAGVDWPRYVSSGLGYPLVHKTSKVGGRVAARLPRLAGWPDRLLAHSYSLLSEERLNAAIRLIGSARAIATDRLHGHVLALLMGVPHVLVDNSYGKLRRFYEAWTSESSLTWWAEDLESAEIKAASLAQRRPGP